MVHCAPRHPAAGKSIQVGEIGLSGVLVRPADACGLVLFSDDGETRPTALRSMLAAGMLNEHRLATLNLEPQASEPTPAAPAGTDVEALGERVLSTLAWLARQPDLQGLRIGLFGSGLGAAAALMAAAAQPAQVAAVVSRGGRPDLAGAALARVSAPTMLIVGGDDSTVIQCNRRALHQLRCAKRLELVPRATHWFEERGALLTMVELAAWWFGTHLEDGHRH